MLKRKTLYYYIFKELLSPFFLGLFIFTFILLMNKILKLMDMVINKGIGLLDVVKLVVFVSPSFLVLTLPMSLVLAILVSLGRLSVDEEITAMKASGVSLYQILLPFFTLCVIAFMLTNIFTLFLLPKGNLCFRNHLFKLAERYSEANLKERIFNDNFEGLILYINQVAGQGDRLKGILISDKREFEVPSVIIAQEGMIIADQEAMKVTLRLFNGSMHRTPKNSEAYQKASFRSYDMNLQLGEEESEQEKGLKYREMSVGKLFSHIREKAKAEQSSVRVRIETHKRFAFPFACLVFGLVGVPLGAYRRKGGKSYGFILSLILILLYYLFFNLGEAMAKRGIIAPFIGIWMPNIIFGTLGLYLLRLVTRETPVNFLNRIDESLSIVGTMIKTRFEK